MPVRALDFAPIRAACFGRPISLDPELAKNSFRTMGDSFEFPRGAVSHALESLMEKGHG